MSMAWTQARTTRETVLKREKSGRLDPPNFTGLKVHNKHTGARIRTPSHETHDTVNPVPKV
jgi:hypothetical protein